MIILKLKICCVCKFPLPEADFYSDKTARDGLSYACRECTKKRARAWQANPINRKRHTLQNAQWRAANPERQKAIQDRAARTPAGRRNTKLYRERNRHKFRARGVVNNYVRSGRLKKQPCEECGAPKAQAHHEDYSKPLDVTWLCQKCHAAHHRSKKGT